MLSTKVGLKIHNFGEVLKIGGLLSQNSHQNRVLDTSVRRENSKRGHTCRQKCINCPGNVGFHETSEGRSADGCLRNYTRDFNICCQNRDMADFRNLQGKL